MLAKASLARLSLLGLGKGFSSVDMYACFCVHINATSTKEFFTYLSTNSSSFDATFPPMECHMLRPPCVVVFVKFVQNLGVDATKILVES